MPKTVAFLDVDLATETLKKSSITVPVVDGKIHKILSIRVFSEITTNGKLPDNVFFGISPKPIDSSVTTLSLLTIANSLPKDTFFDSLVSSSAHDGTSLKNAMMRENDVFPGEDVYGLTWDIFVGQAAVLAGAATFKLWFEVEYETVPLTNKIATELALSC